MSRSGRLRAEHRAPDVRDCLWLWRAFQELHTCRAIGFGTLGPIPLTAIWEYVDRYQLPDWTIDAIFSLDACWQAQERARVEQAQPARQRHGE